MARTRSGALAFAALVSAASAAPAAATINFTDGTFSPGSYNVTGPFKSDPSITTTGGQCSTCGNPGNGLEISATFSAPGSVAWGFVNNGFVYDPSTQGTLIDVLASVDKNLSVTLTGTGFTNTFRPLVYQDGNFYLATIALPTFTGPTTTGYQNASGTLTASDFVLFDFITGAFGSGNPNFSGDALTFGLGQITGSGAVGQTGSITADYDNLSFKLDAVPEPATWLMMLAGFAAVGLVLRREPKRAAIT